ncbi:MAG: AMP-binding protein [Clostridia bacterium]|nr:AMP-binding protein [Clostridia bacterium]
MNLASKYLDTTCRSYEEMQQRLKLNIPESFNFGFDIVDEYARLCPEKRALVWCNDKGQEKSFTFGEISTLSNKLASSLAAMGIKKGDFVMLIMKRRAEYWITYPALHKLGAVAIPATHMLTKKDVIYRNNAAGVKMIIAAEDENILSHVDDALEDSPTLEHRVLLGEPREGWISFDSLLEAGSEEFTPAERAGGSDPMLMFFTSGTTGMPKMVLHDFNYPLGHILTAVYWHKVVDDGLHISVADTGWAKCGWGKCYGQWIAGSAQFVYDYDGKFNPLELITAVSKHKVNTFCAPPTIYRGLIKQDLSHIDFSCFTHFTTAGEPLNPEVFRRWREISGHRIFEAFGQSEGTPILGTYFFMDPREGSTGKPNPLLNVDLVDEDRMTVGTGEEGQIVLHVENGRPAGLFCGYYKDVDKTAEVWQYGLYYTGDVAWKDEDGYFFFIGRSDDVIKSSGYRIGPFEVESALMEHPAVLECAVTGVPDVDGDRGQLVKATIALTNGYEASDALKKELQNHVKRVTAPYKYPRIIEFVDEIEKTISGKMKHKAIRERDERK